jgi:hypothetical protein
MDATDEMVEGLATPTHSNEDPDQGLQCSKDACRDKGNDCCASIDSPTKDLPICAPGYAPTRQPAGFGKCPNYECCKKPLPVAWIGLNDRVTEGAWVWSEGEPLRKLGAWAAGEPTNVDTQCGEENCVAMTGGTNGGALSGWADVGCTSIFVGEGRCVAARLPYICKKELAPRKLPHVL